MIAVVAVLAIVAIIGIACFACAVCQGITSHWGITSSSVPTEQRSQIEAAADNVQLYVNTIGGNVEIRESADPGNVTVTYIVHASDGRLDSVTTNTTGTIVDDHTRKITAEAKIDLGSLLLGGTRGADVCVDVPKNSSCTLNLVATGGNIKVPPLHGDNLTITTTGGNVEINGGAYASVTASTTGGNIDATYEADQAMMTTTGGNIDIDTTQTAGRITASTTGGNIGLSLPYGTLFSVDAGTFGGRVRHAAVDMTASADKDWQLTGHTAGGAGNLTISLHTTGGNIDIGY